MSQTAPKQVIPHTSGTSESTLYSFIPETETHKTSTQYTRKELKTTSRYLQLISPF